MSLSKNEIKFIRSIQLKKFRDEHDCFVVEGIKLVEELCSQKNFVIKDIYATEEWNVPDGFENLTTYISSKDLERISGLKNPNQVLAIAEKTKMLPPLENNLILLLDNIKDPGNLGTIIRTADWFGLSAVILSNESVDRYNPKVIQSSMGSFFRVPCFKHTLTEFIPRLKEQGFDIVGAEMHGEPMTSFKFSSKTALVMGSESHGIRPEIQSLLDRSITIERFGEAESLNVSIACAIITQNFTQKIN